MPVFNDGGRYFVLAKNDATCRIWILRLPWQQTPPSCSQHLRSHAHLHFTGVSIIGVCTHMTVNTLQANPTNSVEQKSSWEANSRSDSQEIQRLYETRMFNIVFRRARHYSLSSVTLINIRPITPNSRLSFLVSLSDQNCLHFLFLLACHEIQSSTQDFNLGTPEYEAGMLTTRPQHSKGDA